MCRAKCAATRGAAALAPPYFAVSINDHCRLQIMAEIVIHVDRGSRWLRLQHPVRVIAVRHAADLDPALREIEQLGRTLGYHAAGFITYEAGRAYGLRTCESDPQLPLAWFALFEASNVSDVAEPVPSTNYSVGTLTPSIDRVGFDRAFAQIRRYIADG